MPPAEPDREELIALVDRIMRAQDDEAEEDRLVQLFEDSVTHPAATDLIFYPHEHFGPEYRNRMPTPAQVVDAALAYQPIQLGPGS